MPPCNAWHLHGPTIRAARARVREEMKALPTRIVEFVIKSRLTNPIVPRKIARVVALLFLAGRK